MEDNFNLYDWNNKRRLAENKLDSILSYYHFIEPNDTPDKKTIDEIEEEEFVAPGGEVQTGMAE